MTFDEIRIALQTRMVAWTDAPLAFDGHPAPPAVESAQAAKTPWCRVTIRDGDSGFATAGSTLRPGVLFVQVFTADGIGDAPARQLASSLAAHLEGWTSGALRLEAATLTNVGPDNGWYQVNVSVPWRVYA